MAGAEIQNKWSIKMLLSGRFNNRTEKLRGYGDLDGFGRCQTGSRTGPTRKGIDGCSDFMGRPMSETVEEV